MQHDSGYHLLFSHPELVEDLFKSFVTEPWVDQLDFSTLERVNAKLHAEGLDRRDGDMIYRVLYRDGSEVYLYLLLEFQSTPDPWMALRVVVYTSLLLQHLIRENRLTPTGKLPPVFPLVLYNGDSRWNAAQELKELIALPDATPLWPYQPSIRYYLVDESRYPEGKPGSLVGVLFQIENCRSVDELRPLMDALAGQWKTLIPPSLRRAFISWMFRVVMPGKGFDANQVNVENLAEVQVMLATRVKQWEQELLKKGREEGREEGVLTGEVKLLCRQLELKFGTLPGAMRLKVEHASSAELDQWGLTILTAKTLDEVFQISVSGQPDRTQEQ